ncbi:MAG: metal-dependent hydrolase [Candidatus Hodarchaeota archaeon]
MWFFSHASVGYLTTLILLRREERTRIVMMAGTFSGMLPDSDILLIFWSKHAFIEYHRTFSHSLVFCLVTSLLLYINICSSCSGRVFQTFFAAGLSHLLVDVFMDLHYPYGIALLWPFSNYLFNFQVLDRLLSFGFVTSGSVSFIVSSVTAVITMFITFAFLEREKKHLSSFSSPTQKFTV